MLIQNLLAIGMPGVPEMLIIAFIILLLFGGAKLPGLMKNMGRSIKEFKTGMADQSGKIEKDDENE